MPRRNLQGPRLVDRGLLPEASDDDPMASVGNLMDVMLVFACGLLLALIAHWNVDIAQTAQSSSPDVTAIEGELQKTSESVEGDSSQYEEVGTTYRDRETGELYVVSPN